MTKLSQKSQTWLVVSIIVLMLVIDQAIKFYIKLNFTLGETRPIFSWFHLCFVENDGMAFGIEWFDKMFLTLFRIIAVGAISWYLHRLIKNNEVRIGFLVLVALIAAGALGNILDCLFYGLIFSQSTYSAVATLFPADGGYATFLYGRVVDMFYFPLITNSAGETIFFRPVFNFADSCITVAVIAIVLFYSKDLNKSLTKEDAGHGTQDSSL